MRACDLRVLGAEEVGQDLVVALYGCGGGWWGLVVGLGRIYGRFGGVEERRWGGGRAGVGCDDMVGVEVGSVGLKFGRDGDDASSVAWEV